jgi:hypothetical protein
VSTHSSKYFEITPWPDTLHPTFAVTAASGSG